MMLALLCAGQGRLTAQSLQLSAQSAANHGLFAHAAYILQCDPIEFLNNSDSQTRAQNIYNQFFSVLTALSNYQAIQDVLPEQFCVAGYSVGEVAAFTIANMWQANDALDISVWRAKTMAAANPIKARLAFVMGLSQAQLQQPLSDHHCVINIYNPDNFYVFTGQETDISALCPLLTQLGAQRCGLLDVFIPSHSHFLNNAVTPMTHYLSQWQTGAMMDERLLFSGLDGERIFTRQDGLAKLANAIAQPLHWHAVLQSLYEQGVSHVLELGPGNALTQMIKNHYPSISAYAVDDFHSLDGIRQWLIKIKHAASKDGY